LSRTRRGLRVRTVIDYKNMTLEQLRQGPYLVGKHKSQFNIYVRALGRTWNKHKLDLPCQHCGYSKHVELAHIKAISSFDPNSSVWDVNNPNNVVQLCPNCHWEFDSGMIPLDQICGATVPTQTGI